jgi:hypothetical protein
VLLIDEEIIHALQIDQKGALDMWMGFWPVKTGAVRHIRDIIAVTDLDYLLYLFCGAGHNDAARDSGHHAFIAQTAFITSRTAPVRLADNRIIRDISGPYNGFQYIINFFGYRHSIPP